MRPRFVQLAGRRKRKPKICAGMTWEIITQESAEQGDVAYQGWEFERQEYPSVRAIVEDPDIQYKSWGGWACSPAQPDDWIVGEGDVDMYTGEETRYDLFVRHCDGAPLTHGETWFLHKKLGLRGKIAPKSAFDEARRYHRLFGTQRALT